MSTSDEMTFLQNRIKQLETEQRVTKEQMEQSMLREKLQLQAPNLYTVMVAAEQNGDSDFSELRKEISPLIEFIKQYRDSQRRQQGLPTHQSCVNRCHWEKTCYCNWD